MRCIHQQRSRRRRRKLTQRLTPLAPAALTGRTAALRKVADSNSVVQAEFNPAFVLMEYFGYLRRDPDADGYNFWLTSSISFRETMCRRTW